MDDFRDIYEELEFFKKQADYYKTCYEIGKTAYDIKKEEIAKLKKEAIPTGTHSYFTQKDKERLEKMKFLTPDFTNLIILN